MTRVHLLMVGLVGILGILVARSSQLLSMPETIAASTIEQAIIAIILLGIGWIGSKALL